MIDVLFVLLPGSLILDWAGPAEALRMANTQALAQGAPAPFHLRFVGPQAQCQSSVGLGLSGLEPLPQEAATRNTWVVLVGQAGDSIDVQTPAAQALVDWLRGLRLQAHRLELVTVCAGAVLAAHAGLLHGKRATTHHHHLEELARIEPACDVVANRVFVEDGAVFSSAGVTTGIDLFLHRISAVCGPALAARVAQTMVVALRRGPHDPEFSPFLAYRNHLHAALHRVQDAVSQAPQDDWNVPRMAEVAHTSTRHLTRLFLQHTAIAPLEYLRHLRLAVAQTALQAGHNVTQAAHIAGFSSDVQLRRTWHHFGLQGTPRMPSSTDA